MTHSHPEAQEYEDHAAELLAAAKLPPVTIVDVIRVEGSGYFKDRTSYYVVVSRALKYIYSRTPNEQQHYYRGPVPSSRFTGKDGDFYDFLAGTGGKGDAFAGRTFDIELDDGTKFHCAGDVWSVGPAPGMDVAHVGVASQEQLNRCYVFCGGEIERRVLQEWLANNTPKSEYYALDPNEPARKAYQAQRAIEEAERLERQKTCVHDYEEIEDTTEAGSGPDVYEVDCTYDRCTICGHETEPRIHDESWDEPL